MGGFQICVTLDLRSSKLDDFVPIDEAHICFFFTWSNCVNWVMTDARKGGFFFFTLLRGLRTMNDPTGREA